MSFITEMLFLGMSFLIFLFGSPILFEVIGISGNTGATGFITNIFPWVILLVMFARGVQLLRSAGSA